MAKINNGVALGLTTATSGNLLIGSGTQWVTKPVTGDVTITAAGVTAIGTNKVTYGQMQQGAIRTLVGNPTGATANLQAITLGTNLSFSGSVLNATGSGGGSVTPGVKYQHYITNASTAVAWGYGFDGTAQTSADTTLAPDSPSLWDATNLGNAANFSMTLPAASTCPGKMFAFTASGGGYHIIYTNAGDTIIENGVPAYPRSLWVEPLCQRRVAIQLGPADPPPAGRPTRWQATGMSSPPNASAI